MMEIKREEQTGYPIRINRYLALSGTCSRREADTLIAQGIVFVNGKKAKIGDKVFEKDVVSVDSKTRVKKYAYLAYNKPKGKDADYSKEGMTDVFSIGSLEKDSRGLVILTNDGRITSKLLSPEYEYEREYIVSVNKPVSNIFLKIIRQGVRLEDFKTKPCVAEKKSEKTFRIVVVEEKKHQIRRMCANLGWSVVDLNRTRIANIRLGNLGAGQARNIEGKERAAFLEKLGIKIEI